VSRQIFSGGTFVKLQHLFLFLICVTGGVLQAQTSQIQGAVKDSSGSTVPGAEVKATQSDTGAVRSVTSAGDGGYILSNLPVGPYRIEVTKAGFSTYVQTGIVLQVDASPTIDVILKVGAVSEQVQVEANATLVETQTNTISKLSKTRAFWKCP
jgi:hypothetical protein